MPLGFKVGSGNETDSQTFAGIAKSFAEQWQVEGVFVMDAAFYSEPNLKEVGTLKWLMRVPQTLRAAQAFVGRDEAELNPTSCQVEVYRFAISALPQLLLTFLHDL